MRAATLHPNRLGNIDVPVKPTGGEELSLRKIVHRLLAHTHMQKERGERVEICKRERTQNPGPKRAPRHGRRYGVILGK
jgi:hypothetical protein